MDGNFGPPWAPSMRYINPSLLCKVFFSGAAEYRIRDEKFEAGKEEHIYIV